MSDREKMLKSVQCYSFAAFEASLFLDTHPDCREALDYYKKYKKLWQEAKDRYEAKYGPPTISSDANNESWQWVKGPWPWELCANEKED